MMSSTNPNTENQNLEIDLTKEDVMIGTKEEVKTSETPKWDGRGIRLDTREEFISYVQGRVRSELAREVLDHVHGDKVSEKDIDSVLGVNFNFVTKNIPKEENFPVTINPGHHNSSLVFAGDRLPFHRGERFLPNIKQVSREILSLLEATETGSFKVFEIEEDKGIIETFFIYSTKGENLPLVAEKPKKVPKPKTAMEEALNQVGIKKSPTPHKEPKETFKNKDHVKGWVELSALNSSVDKPKVIIKGKEVIVKIPEGYSVVIENY